MIQPALPTSSTLTAIPLDTLLQGAAQGPETPDFAALLASSLPAAALPEAAAAVPVPIPSSEATPAEPEIAAPATGKILPPGLPLVAAAAVLPEAEAEADPAPAVAVPLKPEHVVAAKIRPGQLRRDTAHALHKPDAATRGAPKSEAPEAVPATESEVAAASEAQPAAQPQAILPVATELPPASQIAFAAPAPSPASTSPADPAPNDDAETASTLPGPSRVPARAEPAARALAQAAPQAAFLRAPTAPSPDTVKEPRAAEQTAERPAPVLRVEVAAPAAAEAVRPSETRQLQRRNTVLDVTASSPLAIGSESASAPQQVAPSATVPAAGIDAGRPHDFTALVDRLVAAREAVQPHAATLTVAHADFGPIELRFRHEDRGLAVTLANADPDFARAAAAAPPPVMPAAASAAAQGEGNQPGQLRDASTSAGASSGGQQRGQQGDRRGDQSAQSNQPPRGPARPLAERRSGIFA